MIGSRLFTCLSFVGENWLEPVGPDDHVVFDWLITIEIF